MCNSCIICWSKVRTYMSICILFGFLVWVTVTLIFTETEMSSFWRNFRHWLHWKLSFWQLSVQPVMKISSKWWHFRFSVCHQIARLVWRVHCLLDIVALPIMMTSWNGNIFRVTGHLCGEFTGPRWIPRTKASVAKLSCFLWSASE